MRNYYNTNRLPGPALAEAQRANEKQETRILSWMNDHPGVYSAWDLQEHFPAIPITSIRRALFNLTETLKIREVGMTIGRYGKPVTKFTAQSIHQFSLFEL